jgi:chemosensory pili system protein ChpA (sensor histidine kinase/response regulator)
MSDMENVDNVDNVDDFESMSDTPPLASDADPGEAHIARTDAADTADASGAAEIDVAEALAQRSATVREFIRVLAISPTPADVDDTAPPIVLFERLVQRLERLLDQAGMGDCARSVESLENAIMALPSQDSLRTIDAVFLFIRARLHDVALTQSAAVAAVVEVAESAGAVSFDMSSFPEMTPIISGAEHMDHKAGANTFDGLDGLDGLDDDGMFDESQFSAETQALIRTFRETPLRQRAPGEITRAVGQPMGEDDAIITEESRHRSLLEALGDLGDLRTVIATFSKMPGSLDDLRDMWQLGHKMKGNVSTYRYEKLAEMLLAFEGVPKALQPVAVARSAACLSIFIRFSDLLEAAIREAEDHGDASAEQLAQAQGLVAEASALVATTTTTSVHDPSSAATVDVLSAAFQTEKPTLQIPSIHRGVENDTLRIESRQLDGLMHHSDGLAMNRAALAQTSEEISHVQSDIDQVLTRLANLSAQLTDLHPFIRQAGDGLPATTSGPRWIVRRQTSIGTWDDLQLDANTVFDSALRSLAEAVLDANTLSGNLHALIQRLSRNSDAQRSVLNTMQQTIIHLRLVNLRALANRVMLAAHQAAEASGKQVKVTIQGQDTEIDRNISDALIAPILQLVTNAVAHGIELPEQRVSKGKPAQGNVWLHASNSGREVTIEVGDDGRGINPHSLIAAAISTGILPHEQADYLTLERAFSLMFEAGLSTQSQVDVIAGHGIGLDSVKTAIQRLRGAISVRSEPRKGTVFQIRVPISLSITHALRVRAAENDYAIPFASVRQMFAVRESEILVSLADSASKTDVGWFPRRVRVARPSPDRPLRLPDDPNAALYDEVYAFTLAELLGLEETPPVASKDEPASIRMALLVEVGQREVAVLVDAVVDESEVVIRALPEHLRRQAVRGATIMADGRLLLVLDLAELAELMTHMLSGKSGPPPRPQPTPPRVEQRIPQVLVVDDSISMRRALSGALSSVGYDVRVARDGVEALGMMMTELPDIMVLDIEMPRLDGFELLSIIRGNEALARVPVVILTSRAAEKYHKQAMELGVRRYLTKPCPDEILISTLQRVYKESQQES